jgi:hypothetical protein
LTAFLDNELTGRDREKIESHLAKCPPCQAECEELKGCMNLVGDNVAELSPSPEMWDTLRVRIAEIPAPLSPPGFFRFLVLNRWATAAATMAATVLLALALWGYMEYRQSQEDFNTYMSEYIQMRNITERLHSMQMQDSNFRNASMVETSEPNAPENPFAEIRPVNMTNPFRAEER